MKQIKKYSQLMDLISEVRNRREGFITNFYPDSCKHQIWIDNKALYYICVYDTTFLIKKNRTFMNVFYVSTSFNNLRLALKELKHEIVYQHIVFDIIGTAAQCLSYVELFRNEGFRLSTSLTRMQRLSVPGESFTKCDGVEYAKDSDLAEISNCLHKYFKAEAEQIPYDTEILAHIKSNHILVVRDGATIAGFLMFEKNISTLYLRYWFSRPEYRDKKVGSMLIHQFFFEGSETRRQILWVIDDNENAIKRYIHYGFKNEDMHDYIIEINN